MSRRVRFERVEVRFECGKAFPKSESKRGHICRKRQVIAHESLIVFGDAQTECVRLREKEWKALGGTKGRERDAGL